MKLFTIQNIKVITQDLDIGSDASLLIIIFLKNRKIIEPYKKLKGNAIITNKLLIPLSSALVPMAVSPSAVAVMIHPHPNLCFLEGVSFPLSLNIPKTNIAESTELIIEVSTNNPAIKTVIKGKGKCPKKINNELKILLNCVLSPVLIISKAEFANMENHITVASVGMKIVVIKNSFIVLPLDILAIKIPVNGTQASQKAQ